MRTSASQFQLLVEFMERYGDLSKPGEGPQGRITNMKRWAQLTQLLNADGTGDTKTAEKWRKVWSDLKNNTKKKAAKIGKAARGTGGGPASKLKLTDLELKVQAILGPEAATGIEKIPEVGLEEEVTEPPPETNDNLDNEQDNTTTVEDWNRPGTSAHPAVFPPDWSQSEPRPITSPVAAPLVQEETGYPVQERSETFLTGDGVPPAARTPLPSSPRRRRAHQSPTPLPPTPRRRRRARLQDPSSPIQRRTRTQTQSDLARQAFVRSDCEWRAFQQETERERNRLRQVELTMQERWLALFGQFLLLGNRIVDILEKNNRE